MLACEAVKECSELIQLHVDCHPHVAVLLVTGVTTTGDDISSQLLTGPVPGPRPPRGPPPSAPPGSLVAPMCEASW